MQAIILFLRSLLGPSDAQRIEALHVRLLNDWIIAPDPSFIHPHQGVYEGRHVYDQYRCCLTATYSDWHQVTKEVIGSAAGGIVTGEYQFRPTANGFWYTAPFSHFYRIHQGQVVGVRYYMGDARMQLPWSQSASSWSSPTDFCSLN